MSAVSPTTSHFYQHYPVLPLIPISEIKKFQGLYGIDLKEVQVDMLGRTNTSIVNCAAPYLDPTFCGPRDNGGPVKISYAEAFEFVIRRLNQCNKGDTCVFNTHPPSGHILGAITNIAHKDKEAVKDMEEEYVSWFRVICRVLQDKGHIKSYELDRQKGQYKVQLA